MTFISDSQYFSPVIWFNELNQFSHGIIDQYDRFQKMSFRNRCTLLGGNGPIHLSIPIAGGRGVRMAMKEVRIDIRERGQDRHWKTIQSCYNKSPFFEYYKDGLAAIYSRQFVYLLDWNMECLRWVCDKLSITTGISLSESWQENYDPERFRDLRNRIVPSGIAAFGPGPRYPQVFEDRFGFVPNLSILDKLFCAGPY